ncbi:MAG: hypothetical protein IPG94_19910 [Kineosporiaceae bacterium]|nr:hypothetical protein [Kineosporiaceae bacterium]
MAWLKSRTKQDGTVQYTGMYRDLQGHERSAGTHTSKREALRKAAAAESQSQAGKVGDPKRGRQTLRHYVEHEWLPNHVMEDSTRESYTYVIERHILGPLGRMRLVDIMPWHIRDWITELAGQGSAPQPSARRRSAWTPSCPRPSTTRSRPFTPDEA